MKYLFYALILLLPYPAFSNTDSLKHILTARQDTQAVLAGYELGKIYISIDLDSSLMFLIDAALLADSLDYIHGKIVTYRSIGSVAPRINKYNEGLHWLYKGMRMIDSLSLDPGNRVDFLTNIGVAHYRIGMIGKAIEPYIEAVEVCRINGYDVRRSRLLNNLGIFYRILERHEEALDIYSEAYDLRNIEQDTSGMANVLFNMASAYAKLKDQNNAIEKLDEAEALYTAIGSTDDIMHCKVARGTALTEIEEYDLAYLQFQKVLSYPNLKLESPFNFNLYQGLATVLLKKNKVSQAETYALRINDEVMASGLAQQTKRQYEIMSEVHREKGQFKNAYEYLIQLKNLTENISEKDKISFRQEMETKYLTKEKEYEIDLLNTKNEVSALKLSSAKQRNIGLGIGLVIFGGLFTWLYQLYKKTKQQNKIISKANEDKEVLLKEIHHRVKNNLQVVSSLLTLQSKYVDNDSALDAINTGKSRVQSMSILHRNLYQNENLKNIKIKPYFEDLLQNLVNTYKVSEKEIHIDALIDDLELDIDTVIPMGLITNELISNALKYAFKDHSKNAKIRLTIANNDEHLSLIVSDNGVGVFFTEIPNKSKTLGMQLVKSFSNKLKASTIIDNSNGTTFTITIPYSRLGLTISKTG